MRKHGIPAFIGPFFDAYFRIAAAGGDIEKISILMIILLGCAVDEEDFCVLV